jgi:hypothetical protein
MILHLYMKFIMPLNTENKLTGLIKAFYAIQCYEAGTGLKLQGTTLCFFIEP